MSNNSQSMQLSDRRQIVRSLRNIESGKNQYVNINQVLAVNELELNNTTWGWLNKFWWSFGYNLQKYSNRRVGILETCYENIFFASDPSAVELSRQLRRWGGKFGCACAGWPARMCARAAGYTRLCYRRSQ